MRLARLIDEYLIGWVILAVLLGVLVPELSVVTRASTPILVVMVGSTSLLLSLGDVQGINRRVLGGILLAHLAMPLLAFTIATVLGLSPALTAGFVLLGAVTPELVSPTMTALADGDIALSSISLVAIGLLSVLYTPASVTALLGETVHVDSGHLVSELLVAVVPPMAIAVLARSRYERIIARYDDYYTSVASVMVILIIGGVAAANATHLRAVTPLLALVVTGAFALNLLGYGLGWTVARLVDATPAERLAGTFAVGMRDFAVAAALVVAAGFPAIAALPAICFGIVEMVTSAAIARLATRN
ncbi:bile acid:sodium symporter (plasmid) [Halarchaeum sp. CBA1220]|uniref:bile acid:sodium symporter family protein n=1 Tax=Halarchaeum sp. CBA1220 TaxID=1853682 RepID=UPI000F3A9A01|nr:bile acid:sodium symporter [Halarchaeum sp. CBA1220]QLC35521.1 bile acid:sodium symporter [Halarchaeum sp. CBA1220]